MPSPSPMRHLLLLGAVLPTAAALSQGQTAPRLPFPAHVHCPGAAIRVNNFTQAQQDADVRAAYYDWKRSYVVKLTKSPGEYRIAFGKKEPNRAKTVSEGQGYGMVITALMAGHDRDAQTVFDGLWRFARAHPSSGDPRFMAWQIPTEEGDKPDSAFDGDADIAYALLLADKQWGGGSIDYRAEAVKVISGLKEAAIGMQSHLPLLGDWVGADAKGGKHNQWQARSSDFVYGHFRAWGRATGDAAWNLVTTTTQAVTAKLQATYAPETGLLPDFIIARSTSPYEPAPPTGKFLEGKNDGAYSYNACRDPWRIGTDAILNNDAVSLAQMGRLSAWVERAAGGDPQKIRAGYKLDGTPLKGSNYFTSIFVAPFGVAAMTSATQQDWLNSLYAAVRGTREDYFEDSVTLLCLLVMTGNFWDATLVR